MWMRLSAVLRPCFPPVAFFLPGFLAPSASRPRAAPVAAFFYTAFLCVVSTPSRSFSVMCVRPRKNSCNPAPIPAPIRM